MDIDGPQNRKIVGDRLFPLKKNTSHQLFQSYVITFKPLIVSPLKRHRHPRHRHPHHRPVLS